ncbi:hypothetical protein F5Y18DRAFT_438850 [Xylariaceae sp. FL1019]|nr:hypothetical protein F5Y18DRAFT_438850 [Xylariaceae sp. FL1019]
MSNTQVDFRATCCNQQAGSPCTKVGSLACKDCLMVSSTRQYCSKRCQTAHWPDHRKDCQSPLLKGTWKPRWMTQNRQPAFMGDSESMTKFGAPKYLWGNVPAIDVVQLAQNEGINFQKPLDLLFAASGDLRNVVLSVTDLPPGYLYAVNIALNDLELDIVARNLIFLLIMFNEEDPNTAADAMLHVWYSAFVTESCYNLLQKKLKPMVEEVCSTIARKHSRGLFGKTWNFGNGSLRMVLTREAWLKLPSYFDVPSGLTTEAAHAVRQAVVNAPSRIDYVDRAILKMSPAIAVGMIAYRKHGVLVPFGQPRDAFTVPNPTVFDSSREWPMMDSADPLDGWSAKTFLATKAGPAKKDAYGQLYHYLKRVFTRFHARLRSNAVSFELYHVDARALDKTLAGRHFDRIEVSNICDTYCLGIRTTLATFSPLLRSPSLNSHATLVTLFLNAVPEAKMMARLANPILASMSARHEMRIALEYLTHGLERPRGSPTKIENFLEIQTIKTASAVDMVSDVDAYFNQYMDFCDFAEAALVAGVAMKAKQTVIPPWPLRVDGGIRPTQKDREDFMLLLSSAHVGHERYVEWKVEDMRTAMEESQRRDDAGSQQADSCLPS